MKRHATALALIVLVSGLASADVPDMVAEALQVTSPSGADGVLVLDEKKITLGPDGRVRTRIHQVQRILTDEGLDVYGDPWIQFNQIKQDMDVKTARVTRADGESVKSTPNAITEITPNHVTHAPRFADLQDMIITFLGLEPGAVSELDVIVEDKKPYRKIAYGSEPLHDGRDIVEKKITIKMPKGKKLSWFTSGDGIEPKIKKTGEGTTYVFSLEDIASVNQHEAAGSDLAPVLYWMEKKSSKKLAARLLRSAPYALGKKKADEEADAIIAVLEAEHEDEMWDPVEEALGIHRRVADDIATVHVDRSIYGDRVLRPSKAFASGYADPIEKLGILHTVFSRLGHDPVPLVSLRHDPGGAKRLHPHNIEGLWLRIAVQGRLLYLDATSSATGEPRGEHVFVLTKSGIEEAPFVNPATTRMRLEAVIDLTADEPIVKGTAVLRGAFNPYWSLFSAGGGCPVEKLSSLIGPKAGFTVTKASFTRLAL
ncbi:MAG: DUF3857 domain-containing protein, partial [Deltaproteobacteria bacterium]|nr:DUF3857 domain-containing protein [Deltaproteobacteria bacterium]